MTEEPTGKGYCLKVLEELGQHPAISFMEDVVAAAVTQIAAAMGVPVHADPYGNLITTYMGPRSDDADMPTIAFVAHMDHPGFEVIDEDGDSYVARALGGVPPASFYPGVPLSIATKDGAVLKAATSGRHGAEDQRMITLELDQPQTLALPAPAVLDLPSFLLKDGLAHMRAADDLAGCAAILAATKELVEGDREANQNVGRVHGIFTLAEEVGLVGARLLAEAGNLPKDSLIVSLEASRSLPGALLGEGPVIRVGDASFTFDAEAESALNRAKEQLQHMHPDFKCQRQLMSGGTCEASAFIYYGYHATGVALPLGNYHNITEAGGIAPEYISVDDLGSTVELIVQAARSVSSRQSSRAWQRMSVIPADYRHRLSSLRQV